MAKSIPSQIVVKYGDPTNALVDITQYVLTINDVDVEQITEETHPFGASWETSLPVGVGKVAPITLGGYYDDTVTTGPNALFAGRIPETPATSNVSRTLEITWNTTPKKVSVGTILTHYKRIANRSGLTKWEAVLQPTGAVTET